MRLTVVVGGQVILAAAEKASRLREKASHLLASGREVTYKSESALTEQPLTPPMRSRGHYLADMMTSAADETTYASAYGSAVDCGRWRGLSRLSACQLCATANGKRLCTSDTPWNLRQAWSCASAVTHEEDGEEVCSQC